METQRVDPRSATWEDYHPTYRVYFWGDAMSSYEYELTGASDVQEVLRWAEDNKNGRTYTAYVVAKGQQGKVGIARVSGTDPTRSD